MEISEEIVNEIVRMHCENEWSDSIITKVVRRKFDIEITIKVVKEIINKHKTESISPDKSFQD